jgi:hypothetical protein
MYVCESASQAASVLLQGTDRAKSGVLPVHTLILERGEIPLSFISLLSNQYYIEYEHQ